MKRPSYREVLSATAKIRRELRTCEDAASISRWLDAYAAAERAQIAAFELKAMFAIPSIDEVTPNT